MFEKVFEIDWNQKVISLIIDFHLHLLSHLHTPASSISIKMEMK